MPIYIFQHPKTNEVKEIIQRMNDEHVYVDAKGVKWQRVMTNPNVACSDTATLSDINPFDKQAFIKKTGKMKKVTQGDLWDMSAELSAKRAAKRGGIDPVKAQAVDAYKKKTGGKDHPLVSK